MDENDLLALLVLLIERNGGSVEVTKEEVTNLNMEGKVLGIIPNDQQDTITLTVEMEEDIDAEYIEG